MTDARGALPIIWVFLFLNFIFCDVFTLFHGPTLNQLLAGEVDGVPMSQEFLLGFSVLMEIGMVMVLVSRFAPHGFARLSNLIVAPALTLVQIATVLSPGLTLHYAFFSVVEIATLAAIVMIAWRWQDDRGSSRAQLVAG
ncbi:DUF6326 family protein [Devosia sp. CAU 1758]